MFLGAKKPQRIGMQVRAKTPKLQEGTRSADDTDVQVVEGKIQQNDLVPVRLQFIGSGLAKSLH